MRDSPLFPNFHRSGARSPAWRSQRCQRNKCDARNSSHQHANVPRLDSACYPTPAQKNILLPVDWLSSAQGGRCSALPEVRREGAASHYQNAIPLLTSNTANTLIWNRRIGLKGRAPCPRQNGCGHGALLPGEGWWILSSLTGLSRLWEHQSRQPGSSIRVCLSSLCA